MSPPAGSLLAKGEDWDLGDALDSNSVQSIQRPSTRRTVHGKVGSEVLRQQKHGTFWGSSRSIKRSEVNEYQKQKNNVL